MGYVTTHARQNMQFPCKIPPQTPYQALAWSYRYHASTGPAETRPSRDASRPRRVQAGTLLGQDAFWPGRVPGWTHPGQDASWPGRVPAGTQLCRGTARGASLPRRSFAAVLFAGRLTQMFPDNDEVIRVLVGLRREYRGG